MKVKRYLLYAVGEILLIVIGILLAMYINNRNTHQQYKNKIDNNLIRASIELESNIEKARKSIKRFQLKDSLIHLVLSDSLEEKDYFQDIRLSTLILNSPNIRLEDQAYQNLIGLNISDNQHQEDLISDLNKLYYINKSIQDLNTKMSNFKNETSIPDLLKSVDSYADLTFKKGMNKEIAKYYLTSKGYKLNVNLYSILAIRNQLTAYQNFYTLANEVQQKIKVRLNKSKYSSNYKKFIAAKHQGEYICPELKDTFIIKHKNDSLFIGRGEEFGNLMPYHQDHFFINKRGPKEFITFFKEKDSIKDWSMRVHLLSIRHNYKKQPE